MDHFIPRRADKPEPEFSPEAIAPFDADEDEAEIVTAPRVRLKLGQQDFWEWHLDLRDRVRRRIARERREKGCG